MTVYTLDPLSDARWADFVAQHESASVFHSVPWLQAIQRTYNYKPVVYTTSAPGAPITNGIVLCQIKSWLTGRRMVSLPFSDHCDPLLDGSDAAHDIAQELQKNVQSGKLKYVELRPTTEITGLGEAVKGIPAYFHVLDVQPPAEDLFKKLHKTSIQQRIKRGDRDGLVVESGNSERLIELFYRLLILTRRRHQLPPQPIEWFRNLAATMGDRMQISVAFNDGKEIASIVTLQHKNALVYKYSCSDSQYKSLGATPCLLWKAILKAKEDGLTSVDLGRSDADNPGLISFKNCWGAQCTELVYLRWSRKAEREAGQEKPSGVLKRLFSMMPDSVLQTTGRILYRHIG